MFYNFQLKQPFKQLQEFADSFDLQKLSQLEDKIELAHVPYFVIIIKALEQWRKTHENDPTSDSEIDEVKLIIDKLAEALDPDDRGNFSVAKKFLEYNLQSPSKVTWFVEDVLNHPMAEKADGKAEIFWILCRAINIFRKKHNGIPPQSSRLPDLNAMTTHYQKLMQAYKLKHEEDVKEIAQIVSEIAGDQKSVPLEYIDNFIENIQIIRHQNYRPYYVEYEKPLPIEDYFSTLCYKWLIAIKAINWFLLQNKRYPNPKDAESVLETINNIRQ